MFPSRSLLAATVIVLGATTSPGSAATFGFDFLSGGIAAADGQFTFADALLGSTVSASQINSFTITFNNTNQPSLPNQTFNVLGSPATPPPLAEGLDEGGFPYFQYNSVTNAFIPFALSNGQDLLIRGGRPVSSTEYRAFNLFAATPTSKSRHIHRGRTRGRQQFRFWILRHDRNHPDQQPHRDPGAEYRADRRHRLGRPSSCRVERLEAPHPGVSGSSFRVES